MGCQRVGSKSLRTLPREWEGGSERWDLTQAEDQVPEYTPLSHQTSLTKHTFKGNSIETFKMVSTKHSTPSMRSCFVSGPGLCSGQRGTGREGGRRGEG